ncbi:MAG: hypoxanthine phosphoribosyltransferase [Cytophagales bacterium]|nr:hypoxanthine phosphoribosyltransferase [Bernardetiaceae bacterium]MDW8203795.1 hypoxanthine phosphoribosyltransferase [Cytophagales bacterium]
MVVSVLIKDKKFKRYISAERLQKRIEELGRQISEDYAGKNPLFIVVLNGAFMFAADLMREIDIPSEVSFIKFTSYQNMHSTGVVDQIIGVEEDLRNRHIVIVEDIIDTGITITEVLAEIKSYQPASVEVAALLIKPQALLRPVAVKYVGFEIEPKFVVGYGLDYDGYGRNLCEILILDEPQKPAETKIWTADQP